MQLTVEMSWEKKHIFPDVHTCVGNMLYASSVKQSSLHLRSTGVSRQHLVEKLVGKTALDKFFLCQYAVVVLVHFVEDLLRPSGWCVFRVTVCQRRTDHFEYCLLSKSKKFLNLILTDINAHIIKLLLLAYSPFISNVDLIVIVK